MPIAGGSARRALCVALALGLAWPATVSAAPDEDVVVLVRRAQKEIEAARKTGATDAASRYSTAAELYGRAAARMPEYEETRVVRDDLLAQAVSAYIEASALAGDDLGPLRAALALVQEHLDALDRVYGRSAAKLPEHVRAREFRDELAKRPGVVVAAPQQLPEPKPEDEPGKAQPIEPIAAKSMPEPEATPKPEPQGSDWRKIGLGVSIGLTVVSLGTAIGTASAVAHEPFEGPLYRDIYAAALRNNVTVMPGVDMCTQGEDLMATEVIDACATRDRVARAAVAMTVMTGVFAVSSVVFGVLLAKSKRRDVAARRQHRPGLGVGPAPGGGFVVLGGSF
jgi:hypothetical protein